MIETSLIIAIDSYQDDPLPASPSFVQEKCASVFCRSQRQGTHAGASAAGWGIRGAEDVGANNYSPDCRGGSRTALFMRPRTSPSLTKGWMPKADGVAEGSAWRPRHAHKSTARTRCATFDARPTALTIFFDVNTGRCPVLLIAALSGLSGGSRTAPTNHCPLTTNH